MRFIADAMLGRLARWLRIAGYDTLYEPDIEDGEILRRARLEERIILTRDRRLAERRTARGRSFLVDSDEPLAQLRQVLAAWPPPAAAESRCPVCNGELKRARNRAAIKDLVPEHVFLNAPVFYRCSSCKRVYWEGTHRAGMEEILNDIINETPKG